MSLNNPLSVTEFALLQYITLQSLPEDLLPFRARYEQFYLASVDQFS